MKSEQNLKKSPRMAGRRLSLRRDFENYSTRVGDVTSSPACLCRPIEVPLFVHDNAIDGKGAVRSASKAMQYSLLASRI